ncbi:MAG: ATP-binding protein [Prevotella sp.]
MKENILGRENEKDLLSRIYDSNNSEFVAVCGRRRVGKTFLIREFFENEMVFQCSGMANAGTQEQLKSFFHTLRRYDSRAATMPTDWMDAFEMLISYLESITQKRKVVFIDELPWMDTQGAQFVSALEHFWNSWASARHDIVLIVCGSATSWMIDKLINNHGGLYGRLTHRIFLSPFTLGEAERLLTSRGVSMSRYEIAEAYMIMGGIPYYLNMIDPRLSLAQNIDRLMFNPNGELYNEFEMLYRSLFNNSESYMKVVERLNSKGYGMTRNEIAETSGIKSGKTLTTILDNLESCGFIRRYNNYGCSERKSLFQLIDFFTLFHFRFMRDSSFHNLLYWTSIQRTPRFYAWADISFEILSACHVKEIKQKLGISGVATNVYSWRGKGDTSDRAAQIDLVIERADNTIDICEMKFTEQEFSISKDYDHILRHKIATFIEETKTRKSVQLVFVTSCGLQRNMYSGSVQAEVTLDDLFT